MDFKTFFGTDRKNIKQNCIICQSYDLSLFSNEISNGLFVKSANTDNATIIALKNNFLAGDAVLFLKNTNCKNIFLFGSCGGNGNIERGDLAIIDKAYNLESFSKMLNFDKRAEFYQSSKEILYNFYQKNQYEYLLKTNSACTSSLKLETTFLDWFKENEISAIDMESSIILSAAQAINRNAACFMYVTDLIGKNIILTENNNLFKKRIASSRKKLAGLILRFCDEQ